MEKRKPEGFIKRIKWKGNVEINYSFLFSVTYG